MRIRKPFLRIGRNLWFWARVLPMVHRNLLVTAQVNARSKLSDKAIRTTGFAFSFIRISIAQIRERGPSSLPESEFRGDLSSYLGRAFFRQIAGGGGSASFRKWQHRPPTAGLKTSLPAAKSNGGNEMNAGASFAMACFTVARPSPLQEQDGSWPECSPLLISVWSAKLSLRG